MIRFFRRLYCKLYFLKQFIANKFGMTGIRIVASYKDGRRVRVDLSDLVPGMFVKDFESNILMVTDYAYDDGEDWVIPLSNGYHYSPLLLLDF